MGGPRHGPPDFLWRPGGGRLPTVAARIWFCGGFHSLFSTIGRRDAGSISATLEQFGLLLFFRESLHLRGRK
jgi:hypothetical protein